jgi:hypothetical protein
VHARIACFQKWSPVVLTQLGQVMTRTFGIETRARDLSGSTRSDSIVCTLYQEPHDVPLDPEKQQQLLDRMTSTITEWARPAVPTVIVRYTDQPAPAETSALLVA